MSKRIALVIGAQCEAMRTLPFVDGVAKQVLVELVGGDDPSWEHSLDGDLPLLRPNAKQAYDVIGAAFAQANDQGASLLIWFIGHGVAVGEDFYLMTSDSTSRPTGHNSIHLAQMLVEQLDTAPNMDGLALVIDTCSGGGAARGVGQRAIGQAIQSEQRVQLLTASADTPAFRACLSQTFVNLQAARAWETAITMEWLRDSAKKSCLGQVPLHLAFDGSALANEDVDGALWLKRNPSFRPDVLSGLVQDAVLSSKRLCIGSELSSTLAAIVRSDNYPVRWITGPSGSGKSVAMALLLRSDDVVKIVPRNFLSALVLIRDHLTLDSIISEVSRQIRVRLSAAEAIGEQQRTITVGLDGLDEATSLVQRQVVDYLLGSKGLYGGGLAFVIASRRSPPDYLLHKVSTLVLGMTGTDTFTNNVCSPANEGSGLAHSQLGEDLRHFQQAATQWWVTPSEDAAVRLRYALRSLIQHAESSAERATVLMLLAADPRRPLPIELGLAAASHLDLQPSLKQVRDIVVSLRNMLTQLILRDGSQAIGLSLPTGFELWLVRDIEPGLKGAPQDIMTKMHNAIADELLGLLNQSQTGEKTIWTEYIPSLQFHLIAANRYSEARQESWRTQDRTRGFRRRGRD